MIRASGVVTGSLLRIGRSSTRQKDITGAPVRSEPKLGKACACLPSANAAAESSSAAVTVPWPPRPWILTSNIGLSSLRSELSGAAAGVNDDHRAASVMYAALAGRADQRIGEPDRKSTRLN